MNDSWFLIWGQRASPSPSSLPSSSFHCKQEDHRGNNHIWYPYSCSLERRDSLSLSLFHLTSFSRHILVPASISLSTYLHYKIPEGAWTSVIQSCLRKTDRPHTFIFLASRLLRTEPLFLQKTKGVSEAHISSSLLSNRGHRRKKLGSGNYWLTKEEHLSHSLYLPFLLSPSRLLHWRHLPSVLFFIHSLSLSLHSHIMEVMIVNEDSNYYSEEDSNSRTSPSTQCVNDDESVNLNLISTVGVILVDNKQDKDLQNMEPTRFKTCSFGCSYEDRLRLILDPVNLEYRGEGNSSLVISLKRVWFVLYFLLIWCLDSWPAHLLISCMLMMCTLHSFIYSTHSLNGSTGGESHSYPEERNQHWGDVLLFCSYSSYSDYDWQTKKKKKKTERQTNSLVFLFLYRIMLTPFQKSRLKID